MTNTASQIQPLTAAAPIVFRAGRATITLFKVVDGFHVQVMQGTQRVDEWSCSYRTEDEARAEARRAAKAFMHFRTADALEAEYHRLTVAIEVAEDRRRPTGNLHSRRDAVQPLRGRAADEALLADMRLTIALAGSTGVMTQPPAQRARTREDLRSEFAHTHPRN